MLMQVKELLFLEKATSETSISLTEMHLPSNAIDPPVFQRCLDNIELLLSLNYSSGIDIINLVQTVRTKKQITAL